MADVDEMMRSYSRLSTTRRQDREVRAKAIKQVEAYQAAQAAKKAGAQQPHRINTTHYAESSGGELHAVPAKSAAKVNRPMTQGSAAGNVQPPSSANHTGPDSSALVGSQKRQIRDGKI